ncbi:MAG: putative low complexity protein [Satyrvirus sp.]|uniref:Putative low complexity protein n=1 Tax=Satyrvirus sp. TaxID=2487771 RepID=A0A3G5AI44_9VIRU|nr:MAG: putative low complexity protein [Satyrvirus sp.]
MSNTPNTNEVTDRTNDSSECVNENGSLQETKQEKENFEVVFFIRYNTNPRPSEEEITKFFNNYGAVHHVKCPENKNYAYVFMSSLSTSAEHRRTRTSIGEIIKDMTPENKFHITVARSNRAGNYPRNGYNTSYNTNYYRYNYNTDPRPMQYNDGRMNSKPPSYRDDRTPGYVPRRSYYQRNYDNYDMEQPTYGPSSQNPYQKYNNNNNNNNNSQRTAPENMPKRYNQNYSTPPSYNSYSNNRSSSFRRASRSPPMGPN